MISKEQIKMIFKHLDLQFGGLWTTPDRIANLPALAAMWHRVLSDLGETALRRGLMRLERSAREFPPTPGQFREMCMLKASDLGLPDVRAAYHLAERGGAGPDLPAIAWHARQQTGPYDLGRLPESVMLPRFRAVYERLVADALALAGKVASGDRNAEMPLWALMTYPPHIVARNPACDNGGAVKRKLTVLAAGEDPDAGL